MSKSEILEKIRAAKRSHVTWVKRARSLIDGVPLDKEQVPVLPTNCVFGQWYYGAGRSFAGMATFRAIEDSHNKLHAIYAEIFKLLFEDPKPSLLGRLLGASAKPKKKHIEAADALFLELQKMSDVIVGKLESLENEIKDMSDQQLTNMSAPE